MTVLAVRTELIAYYERRGYVRTGKTEPLKSTRARGGRKPVGTGVAGKVAAIRFTLEINSGAAIHPRFIRLLPTAVQGVVHV